MQGWNFYNMPFGGGWFTGMGGTFFLVLIAWSLYWKGMALWHAARRGETVWFVALLVINTVGILEILYLYVFSQKQHPVHDK